MSEPKQQALAVVDETKQVAPVSVYEIFSQLARDPNIDPSRIAQLMELHQQAEKWQAEKEFIAAMNRLQPRLPRIKKLGKIAFVSKNTGDAQSTPYARFEDIDAQIRPLLHEEGFSLSFGTSVLEKGIPGILITATLSHSAGHSRTESMPLPLDTSGSKNAVQAVGSTMAYGRRYLTCAMLNIITIGEDDNGEAPYCLDEQQVKNITDMIAACELDGKATNDFLKYMNVQDIKQIRQANYPKAMTALNAKLRRFQDGKR